MTTTQDLAIKKYYDPVNNELQSAFNLVIALSDRIDNAKSDLEDSINELDDAICDLDEQAQELAGQEKVDMQYAIDMLKTDREMLNDELETINAFGDIALFQ